MLPMSSYQNNVPARATALDRWSPWLVFVISLLIYIPSIWSETSVTCSDEYSLSFRTPMEMNDHNTWLTPWLNEEPRLRKPPLIYWAMLSSYKLFGVNLVAARLWAVLAGAGLCLCTCLLARELSRSNGLLAGLLAMGSIGVAIEARQAMLDLPLATFSALGVLFWIRWVKREKGFDLIASAVWVGLSFLMKGPVGFFFFLAGAIATLWMFNAWKIILRRPVLFCLWLFVVAAISLPWPLMMKHLWGDKFAQILGEELTERKFGSWNAGSPFSALGGALGLIFPWTPLVIGAIIVHFKKVKTDRLQSHSLFIAWFVISILPFFFMKAFERYMLAVVPLQAAIAADWLQGAATKSKTFAWRLAIVLIAIVGVFVSAFALWFKLGMLGPVICVSVALYGVTVAFRTTDVWQPTGAAAVVLMLCMGLIYPTLGISSIASDVGQKVGALTSRLFGSNQPALLSMRLGYSVQMFDADKFIKAQTNAPVTEMVFAERTCVADFEKLARERGLKIEEAGRFKTFYSRTAWLRFAREDAHWPEWKRALSERSLESLKTDIHYYRVSVERSQQ